MDKNAGWGNWKVSHGTKLTDDDDDFVTLAEQFGKTKTIRKQIQGKKTMNGYVEKNNKKRNRAMEVI